MPTRRQLLAALPAGLAGCGGRRREPDGETPAPPPMNYEPGTPNTPTPRSSPLSVDESFRWPTPFYDPANSCHPPTSGPREAPGVEWEVWLPNMHRAEYALIDGRRLYVFGDGRLATIDRRTGRLESARELAVDVRAGPTLTDAGVVSGAMTPENDPGVVLQGTDGEQQWLRSDGTLVVPPRVDDGRIVVREATGGAVLARTLGEGTETWRQGPDGDERFERAPALGDGTVYQQTTDGLSALRAATGEREWRRTAGSAGSRSTAVSIDSRHAYYGVAEAGVSLAIGRDSGEVAWERSGVRPVGVHAIGDDRVVAPEATGTVTALARADGTVAWSEPGSVGRPIVAGETVYLRGEAGEAGLGGLVARSLADGQRRFHLPIGPEGWLLVADGYCYVNRGEGVVQCLG